MYKIGLTGGIASGKSTVSHYLSQRGHQIIDADVIARQVVEPNSEGLSRLTAAFGEGLLHLDGTLNRQALAEIMFQSETVLSQVNDLLHPLILEEVERQCHLLDQQGYKHCFIDMPLLFEIGYNKQVDEVWLVYVTPEIQLERLMQRNQISIERANKMIQTQWEIDKKIPLATYIIDNTGSLSQTYQQLEQRVIELEGRV